MVSVKGIFIVLLSLVALLLLTNISINLMRFFGQTTVKIAIGVLFLFFFNVFGGFIGLHIPINLFTIIVTSFLGMFGMLSLAAVHIFVL